MKIFNFTKKGFTLIELIVTVILVAILASYAVYHYTAVMREGEVKGARGKLAALGGALERVKIEHGDLNIEGTLPITNLNTGDCNYQSSNNNIRMMSIFNCGDAERSLGFDDHFIFYFGNPSDDPCSAPSNISPDVFTVFMVPKEEFEDVEEYPTCAFFNPYTDSTVEVQR